MLLSLFKPRPRAPLAVRLQDGSQFSVRPGDTLLDAALAAGLDAPHNCRVGACRTCRCEVVAGSAKSLVDRSYVLDAQEVQRGVYLACQTQAQTDLVVRWEMGHHQQNALPATVSGLRQLTPRVWRVSLTTARPLQALPGQYIGLRLLDTHGEPHLRPYSLVELEANADHSVMHIDVTRHAGGCVSTRLTDHDAVGRSVQVAGPFGDCVAGDGSAPLVAIGAGSGIGAACGALAHSHQRHAQRPTLLLAYGGTAQDIYGRETLAAQARQLTARHLQLSWAETLPVALPGMARGRAPLGLDAIADWAAPTNRAGNERALDVRVLLYGPSGFVDACMDVLHDMGLRRDQIAFDRYQTPDGATPTALPLASTVRG